MQSSDLSSIWKQLLLYTFNIEFLQFGPRAEDETIQSSIEEPTATSQNLTLSTPLVFYGNLLSTINVRTLIGYYKSVIVLE